MSAITASPPMRGWRRAAMMTVAPLAVSVVVLISACSSSAPTGSPPPAGPTTTPPPAATASTSPTPVVFASTRYRYSITLPVGWVATPASATWSGLGAPTIEDPAVDVFGPVGVGTAFGSAAPTTSPLAAWVADGIEKNSLFHSDTCPQKPDSVEPVTIGGQPGMLESLNCGILINTAFTVVNGYGYRFGFRDPTVHAATDPADHAKFTTMLASVVFH